MCRFNASVKVDSSKQTMIPSKNRYEVKTAPLTTFNSVNATLAEQKRGVLAGNRDNSWFLCTSFLVVKTVVFFHLVTEKVKKLLLASQSAVPEQLQPKRAQILSTCWPPIFLPDRSFCICLLIRFKTLRKTCLQPKSFFCQKCAFTWSTHPERPQNPMFQTNGATHVVNYSDWS